MISLFLYVTCSNCLRKSIPNSLVTHRSMELSRLLWNLFVICIFCLRSANESYVFCALCCIDEGFSWLVLDIQTLLKCPLYLRCRREKKTFWRYYISKHKVEWILDNKLIYTYNYDLSKITTETMITWQY